MKKMIAILLVTLMVLSAAFAVAEAPLMGGWNYARSTEITDENRALFDKAMEGLLGVEYEPIAYLGSQVVAGTNHCFLCRATVVYSNALPTLKLVYIYEDLNGNVKLTSIQDVDIAPKAE